MNIIGILKTEITVDPLTRGYAAMSNADVAIDLNTVYRTTDKTSMTGSEVMNAIVKSEFNALTADNKQMIWDILHLGTINPFGLEADLFQDIFGQSTTITNLIALRVNNVSRGVELGGGTIFIADIEDARRM